MLAHWRIILVGTMVCCRIRKVLWFAVDDLSRADIANECRSRFVYENNDIWESGRKHHDETSVSRRTKGKCFPFLAKIYSYLSRIPSSYEDWTGVHAVHLHLVLGCTSSPSWPSGRHRLPTVGCKVRDVSGWYKKRRGGEDGEKINNCWFKEFV